MHTKGPWKADWTRPGKVSWRVVGSDGGGVAAIVATQNRDPEEKEANASLIAAAPELLEALEDLYLHAGLIKNTGLVALEPSLTKARAAIKKAKDGR